MDKSAFEEGLISGIEKLNAWQCRVFDLEYPLVVEELPVIPRGQKKYRMGYLYLTCNQNFFWDLSLKKDKLRFNIGGNRWGMEAPSSGISRSWVESVLFWNHFLDIRRLDMYRKVLGHLRLHPELIMTWAAAKPRLFREAALEVLGGR
jgi:hypothetical protein